MSPIQDIYQLLPFILQPHNIARYEDGTVLIGDRRQYPLKKTFVSCHDIESVAQAIEAMVTQGAGPWQAATCGLALAGKEADKLPVAEAYPFLEKARQRFVATRPTNTAMARRLELALAAAKAAIQAGESTEKAILNWLESHRSQIYSDYAKRAEAGANLMQPGDGILTMCFAETAFILALALANKAGKSIQVFTPETRPYLQGAKLTAPSVHEIGVPVTLISDNMPAMLMSQGKIQKYFTAADLITLDGHVVNKVGTFQLALAAHYHQIPYFVFAWGFDPTRPDQPSIEIEERDPADLKQFKGTPITDPAIPAYYPAFDITPPHLVAGVITRKGVLSPYDIVNHFKPT